MGHASGACCLLDVNLLFECLDSFGSLLWLLSETSGGWYILPTANNDADNGQFVFIVLSVDVLLAFALYRNHGSASTAPPYGHLVRVKGGAVQNRGGRGVRNV